MGSIAEPRPLSHVCIIGGGPVGLISSLLFRRHGLQVTVLEKNPKREEVGAGIQLHPNALRVLQSVNLFPRILKTAITPPHLLLKSYKSGETLWDQDFIADTKRYGAPLIALQRTSLQACLYEEALAQGVVIRHGVEVKPGDVDLENGVLRLSGEVLQADLYVGADGGRSAVREALIGRGPPQPIPHGRVVMRILITEKEMLARPSLRHYAEDGNMVVWLGPDCQVVTYLLDGIFNVAFTWPWSKDKADVFVKPQPVDIDAFRKGLVGWHPDLLEMLSLTSGVLQWMMFEPTIDGEEVPWVDEGSKFVLAGDSAHQSLPYLGQGLAMGYESAALLAALVSKATAPTQVRDALAIYERKRKERTSLMIRATLRQGRFTQMADGPLQEARDRELRESAGFPTAGCPNMMSDPFFQRWMWGFDAEKEADEAWEEYKRGCERVPEGFVLVPRSRGV
ncbi:putative salicylate hydroxylase [Dichotomopilus funicola]|uniref:Salicylate hydroxylase n=1 Tax=Dichotomopilus funicola TaxID=1934379 RepID=A0AAN6V5H5_9PEZI|nr:putative salicylate hydroxylase [Dichotomopilus funicola]